MRFTVFGTNFAVALVVEIKFSKFLFVNLVSDTDDAFSEENDFIYFVVFLE